jgi:hypothetical protein
MGVKYHNGRVRLIMIESERQDISQMLRTGFNRYQ